MNRAGVILVVGSLLAALGCGGGSSSTSNTPSNTPQSGGSNSSSTPTTTTAAAPGTPKIVTVASGDSATGIDVGVVAPVGLLAPNAEDLGVNPLSGTGRATNTGDVIHRGTTMRILMFGPNLSSNLQISVAGPSDIQFSNLQSVTAQDGTTGVAFTATVSAAAALGARTVIMQDANGNVTTFTGGLEVQP